MTQVVSGMYVGNFFDCYLMFQLVKYCSQVVYILDQVRALENEMLLRIKQQGLNITPKILIVSFEVMLVGFLIVSTKSLLFTKNLSYS